MPVNPRVPSVDQARRIGRDRRKAMSRSAHAELRLPERDPVAVIEEQNASRLADLVPVRIGRMLQSPFTYYRGTAGVMARDLAGGVDTGVWVVSCGDAHVSNFGLFASPERRVVFDLNDFDEAGDAPWEWDLKRLVASVHVGARDLGASEDACADACRLTVAAYRTSLGDLYETTALDRYYRTVDVDALADRLSDDDLPVLERTVRKARRRTSDQVLEKLEFADIDGRRRIVDQPPIVQHVEHASLDELDALFQRYRSVVREDIAVVLDQFRLVDYVLRVVGVGSVGTRCYLLLFEGPGGEPLVLQAKEAQASVLATYGGMHDGLPAGLGPEDHIQGHRVVAGQRILQAQSDPFLGWIEGWAGDDRDRRVDYYWRQFRDMKGSVDVGRLSVDQFARYGTLCGALLARAHSQSSGGAVICGYLGRSERFDEAVAAWARAYADVCEADHDALAAAVRRGRLPAESGM